MSDYEIANPYVGPRPFSTKERNLFFGRDREARDLIPLVIAERLVLFYAQSGAGKSSLINARLIPGLRERNFIVLPVGRVSGEVENNLEVDNIYIHNLLVSLDPENKDAESGHASLAKLTLADYLANLEVTGPDPLEKNESGGSCPVDTPQVIQGVQPMALIIDQFEEIFTNHPEAWKQRGPFFEQLGQAMQADPYLWVVLVMREDYVAGLDPFAYLLPGRLRARFYMQRMEYQAALEAVKKPVEKKRPFEDGVAEELVNNLRRMTLGEGSQEQVTTVESQYVEPVQLQVVCYRLWENLKETPGSQITAEDLNRLAKGGNLAQFVSRALAEFYEQSIRRVIEDPSVKIAERKLREWFSTELITSADTRGSVFQGDTFTGSLPNEVVRLLEAQFMVRAETRASGKWYELSHDRFISPILQANRAWLEHNPRPILNDALAWSQGTGRLYEGRQLSTALQQLDSAAPGDFEQLEIDFIRKSEAEENRRRNRRQWVGIGLMSLLVIVFAALAVTSFISGEQARTFAMTAESGSTLVSEQKVVVENAATEVALQAGTAQAASIEEARQRVTAEAASSLAGERLITMEAYSLELDQQRVTAEAASTAAVYERDQAEEARNQARAGQLSSLSDYFRINNLNLSLLLGIEAVNLDDNWDTRGTLMEAVQRGLSSTLSRDGAPVAAAQRPYSIAFSPNGDRLAVALEDGSVAVVFMDGRGRDRTVPAEFKSKNTANTVAFSPDGNILAQGNGSGTVLLWDRTTGKVSQFVAKQFTFPHVFAIAFQPKGDLLAVATQRDSELGIGLILFYNYKTGQVEQRWDCGPYDCTALAWSSDSTRLAFASKGGAWKIVDVANKREARTRDAAHAGFIYGIAWYPGDRRLVTAGIDSRLIQWDAATGDELLRSDYTESVPFISLAISPDGKTLLAGAGGGNRLPEWAILYDAETLKRLSFKMFEHTQSVPAVAFNRQGNRFATASYDTRISIWKFEPVNPLGRLVGSVPGGRNESLYADSSGKLIWTWISGGTVKVFGEEVSSEVTFTSQHRSIAGLTLDGVPVAGLGGADGAITFVDLTTGKPARTPLKMGTGTLRSISVDLSGKLAAAAVCRSSTQCDQIVIRSLADGQDIELKADFSELNLGLVTALAFNSDSRLLAIGNAEGKIILYDLETGSLNPVVTEGLNLSGGNAVVSSLVFEPGEGDLMAAGFFDGRLALWQWQASTSTYGPVGIFSERMNNEVTALLFRKAGPDSIPAGKLTLAATSGIGEVREFEVDVRVWKEKACQLTGNSNLSPEERKKFLPESDPQALTCPQ